MINKIISLLKQHVSDLPSQINPDFSFSDFGLDSNASISIAAALSQYVGFEISAIELQKYESIRSAAEEIVRKMGGNSNSDEKIKEKEFNDENGSNSENEGKKQKKDKKDKKKSKKQKNSQFSSSAPSKRVYSTVEEYYIIPKIPEVHKETKRMDLMKRVVGSDVPYLRISDGVNDDQIIIESKPYINYTSYNYLGLSGDKRVTRFAQQCIARFGTSVSSSRVVGGTRIIHYQLERALASMVGAEDALLYVGGFMANESTIGHFMKEPDLIVYDILAHSSIVQGNRNSHATAIPFPHNDVAALDQLLIKQRKYHKKCMIIAEGVYSMDGDVCDLPGLIEIKKKHKAILFIDEAHSIGVMGDHGRGVGEYFKINTKDVDLWMGTLSKSFASCGGYIAGTHSLIDFLRGTSPGFIYSAGMPPAQVGAALASAMIIKKEQWRVQKLHKNAEYFKDLLIERGFNAGNSGLGSVIPCIIGTSENTLRLADHLHKRGVEASPYYAPAVEEGKARIRFFISSTHTFEELKFTADVMKEEFDIILKHKLGDNQVKDPSYRKRWKGGAKKQVVDTVAKIGVGIVLASIILFLIWVLY
ncbi:MAG: putative 8-amino-7-oxononanoate synthase [Streblomastix strix]|uniref:serine C-palmitoyltransferase n=1 Tax=Streblomastix strix TaxID=222440 RepID=A0A5J4WR00_9EUKA|nr:MAG: putative 8-amino-7-oxononanoate synthase [Streblomastix strix]